MKTANMTYCDACRDPIPVDSLARSIEGRGYYCDECFNELAFGIVEPDPVEAVADDPRRRDETPGPAWENAVRWFEDARAQ